MAPFILTHAHDQSECRVAYAAWRGYDSPLCGLEAMASCAGGDLTHASEVRRVTIR